MENNTQQAEANEQVEQQGEFAAVKARLEEIAHAVDDENLPLDDALDLYEEAVKLGLKASSLLEVGIVVDEGAVEGAEGAAEADAVAAVSAEAAAPTAPATAADAGPLTAAAPFTPED